LFLKSLNGTNGRNVVTGKRRRKWLLARQQLPSEAVPSCGVGSSISICVSAGIEFKDVTPAFYVGTVGSAYRVL
jgi:hypothetical protein